MNSYLLPVLSQESLRFLGLGFFFARNILFSFFLLLDLESRFFQNELVIAWIGFELQLQLLGFFGVGTFFQTNFPVWHDDDRCFSPDRASLLTEPAAIALRRDDDRASVAFYWTEDDSVIRANLIADQADFVFCPHQTHLFSQYSRPSFGVGLFFQGERSDCLCRADLSADIAVLIAGG